MPDIYYTIVNCKFSYMNTYCNFKKGANTCDLLMVTLFYTLTHTDRELDTVKV